MRDGDAGPTVVGGIAVETMENESDETIAIECAHREIRPVAAPNYEIGEVLGGVLRRNVVVAERIVERRGHRLEADAGQRSNLNHRAINSASSPTPRMTSSIELPPRSRANAERPLRESSGVVGRVSTSPSRS